MGDAAQPGQCQLLAGAPAWGAQVLLAAIAVLALLYKRHVERPQRPLRVWGLDVSKQAVSMLAAHICGMLIALIAHHAIGAGASSECAWYFVAFSFDTTIGLALTIGLHRAALAGARWYGARCAALAGEEAQAVVAAPAGAAPEAPGGDRWFEVLQACGNYGDPPSYRRWAIQLAEWVACVVVARVLCGTLVVLLGRLLTHIAQGLDRLFAGHPTLLLYFVMICCPLLMNLAQVLVQDLVLKFKRGPGARGGGGGDIDAPDRPPSVAERVASLAKLGGGGRPGSRAERVAEREASLLGPSDQRSAALV